MELLAFGNGAIQIGLMVATAKLVAAPKLRRMLYAVSGSALTCSVAGLLALAATGSASGSARLPDVAPALTWLLYIGMGAAVVVGIVMATRGRTRFAWPQGRYHKYRSYRRI